MREIGRKTGEGVREKVRARVCVYFQMNAKLNGETMKYSRKQARSESRRARSLPALRPGVWPCCKAQWPLAPAVLSPRRARAHRRTQRPPARRSQHLWLSRQNKTASYSSCTRARACVCARVYICKCACCVCASLSLSERACACACESLSGVDTAANRDGSCSQRLVACCGGSGVLIAWLRRELDAGAASSCAG